MRGRNSVTSNGAKRVKFALKFLLFSMHVLIFFRIFVVLRPQSTLIRKRIMM
jgi:hypothetical protein